MTRTRYKAKTDTNQRFIIQALEAWGWSVQPLHTVGSGVPDLLVAGVLRAEPFSTLTCLVEVKTQWGTLEETQRAFIRAWRGPVYVVRTSHDVAELVHGRLLPETRE